MAEQQPILILGGVGVFVLLLLAIVHRRRPEPKPRFTRADALRAFEAASEAAPVELDTHVADLDFNTRAWAVELGGQVHIVEVGEEGHLTRLPSEVFCDGRTLRSPFRFLSMDRTQDFAFRIGSYDAHVRADFLGREWFFRLFVPDGNVRAIQ